jgi:hypothetical protein
MMLENLRHDIRVAWRGLSQATAFSAAAILTLGLGIAGPTVMFTLIQGVLLRPLPVRDQGQLVIAWKELRASGFAHYPFGDAEIEAVGDASKLLEIVAGVDANGVGREVISEDGGAGRNATRIHPCSSFVRGRRSRQRAASADRADGRRRARAAHRERERGQSAVDAQRRATSGARGP